MNIASKPNVHWTDEQAIEHLYGVGPEDGHLLSCKECGERVSAMEAKRLSVEAQFQAGDEVSFDFLAAQRRKVYARLDSQVGWRGVFHVRRWAPAAAALFVLGAGLTVFEERQPLGLGERRQEVVNSSISDEELASDVSRFADNSEPKSTAPLQALFEE